MKDFKLTLLEGVPHGSVRLTSEEGQVTSYRVSKNRLSHFQETDELKQSGIYLLLGTDTVSRQQAMYIGKSNRRRSGTGILQRVREHIGRKDNFDWQTAIMIVSKYGYLNITETSYLENFFYSLFGQTQSFMIKNKSTPFVDILPLDDQVKLSDFGKEAIEHIQLLDYSNHFISTDYLVSQLEAELETIANYYDGHSHW